MDKKALVISNDDADVSLIRSALSDLEVLATGSAGEALSVVRTSEGLVLVIVDMLPDAMEALALLHTLEQDAQFAIMVIASSPSWSSNDPSMLVRPLDAQKLRKQAKQVLKGNHARQRAENSWLFNAIFQQAPIGITISHGSGQVDEPVNEVFNVNPKFEEITGRTKEELGRLGWTGITHPEDLVKDMATFRRLQAGEIDHYELEKRYIRPDGSEVWVHMVVAPLHIPTNHQYSHICLVQDISERKRAEQRLAESERSKSVLLSRLPGLAYRAKYDEHWTVLYVSEGCKALTGYDSENLLDNRDISFNDIIVPKYREAIRAEWDRVLPLHIPFAFEYEIITKEGTPKWVWETGQGLYGHDGEVIELEGIILDITSRKRVEAALFYRNEHDVWTGLYNRSYLEQLLNEDLLHPNRAP